MDAAPPAATGAGGVIAAASAAATTVGETIATTGTTTARPRRGYIDWLRGLAIVVMIEAHTFDAWTSSPSRDSETFWYVQLIAGWAAPIFLFLAGVSIALASGARLKRAAGDSGKAGVAAIQPSRLEPSTATAALASTFRGVFAAAKPMIWRGIQIWGLALLFRVQSWALSPGATLYGILKVDILNVMGPAIAGAALVWGLFPRMVPRILALAAAASVFGLLTPIVRASTLLAGLPDPIEWYFRPWAGRTTFTFFPWAGFVFAGAATGVLLDRVRDARGEGRMNLWFGAAGAAITAAAFIASYFPSPYAESSFWTSSPCFFFLRVGVLVVFLPLAYAWALRPTAHRFSPLQFFGRNSLFVYWIHVELVYGIISYPLHRNLTLPQACVAFVLFTIAMYYCAVWKTNYVNRRRDRGSDRGPDRDRAVRLAPASAGG